MNEQHNESIENSGELSITKEETRRTYFAIELEAHENRIKFFHQFSSEEKRGAWIAENPQRRLTTTIEVVLDCWHKTGFIPWEIHGQDAPERHIFVVKD